MVPESHSQSWEDIASRIRGFDDVPPELQELTRPHFRVLVATDWSSATVPLALLRAFAEIIPADAPVDLVFAVPHEPTQADVTCVEALLEGLDAQARPGRLLVESFAEAADKSCYGAIVPSGSADFMITEVAAAVVALHQLATLVTHSRALADSPGPVDGPNAGLRRRFDAFHASRASS